MQRDMTTAKSLLGKGADVNAPQGDGMTALALAARHGDLDLTAALLRAHASTRRSRASVPTRRCTWRVKSETDRSSPRCSRRAPTQGRHLDGRDAAHLAAMSRSVAAVNALIDRGADVKRQRAGVGADSAHARRGPGFARMR